MWKLMRVCMCAIVKQTSCWFIAFSLSCVVDYVLNYVFVRCVYAYGVGNYNSSLVEGYIV